MCSQHSGKLLWACVSFRERRSHLGEEQNSAAPSLGGVLREAGSEAAGPSELLTAGEAGYRGW